MAKITKASVRKRLTTQFDGMTGDMTILLDRDVIGHISVRREGQSWSLTTPSRRIHIGVVPGFRGRPVKIEALGSTTKDVLGKIAGPLATILSEDAEAYTSAAA